MFDIGFSEILVIMAIALVVLGPEKLPRLAAQVGRWVGRAKAMARQFREQLEEEANKLDVTKDIKKNFDLGLQDEPPPHAAPEPEHEPHNPAAPAAPHEPQAAPAPEASAHESAPAPPAADFDPRVEASVDSAHERRH
jgi:sec-independent protein translocase protein TatB